MECNACGKDQVLELFKLMEEESKVKPDSVTFLAVLSGYSHGGLEDKGLEIFDEMVEGNDEVEAEIEHYGCVVDLLGRAGRVLLLL
jgi:pentatricopeptide repeat protein